MTQDFHQAVSAGALAGASREGTFTSASPSTTIVSPTEHTQSKVTRPLGALISRTVQVATTVSPMRTGALKRKLAPMKMQPAPGQPGAEHRRHERHRQHAVHDASLEAGGLGIGFVEMDRVEIARHQGEFAHIGFADRALVARALSDLKILNKETGDFAFAHGPFPIRGFLIGRCPWPQVTMRAQA